MSIINTTKSAIQATVRSIWQGERPDADDTRYSDLWLYSRITAAVVWRLLQTIDRGVNAVFPTTSFGIYLDNWLNWIGAPDGSGNGTFGRIQSRGSSGTSALAVVSTGAATTSIGDQLTDVTGRTYQLTEGHVYVGASTYNHSVAAVDTGSDTNLESGDVLTFTSPPAGITTATLVKDLDGGADRETDAEGRARLLSLLRNPPSSGNVADWVDISIVLGNQATSDQKCDWDAQGNKTTVSTNDAGGNTIVASGNITYPTITNGLAAGDRVVINGYEATCASVTNATTFEVSAWPSEWGSALDSLTGLNITSGGGFIGRLDTTISGVVQGGYGIVQAVADYMDGRGPNVLQAAAQSEIPGWDSTARIQELESAAFVVGLGNITSVTVNDLGGGVIDLSHTAETGATAKIYDIDEITIWQTYV
jgi:hypothetical protein